MLEINDVSVEELSTVDLHREMQKLISAAKKSAQMEEDETREICYWQDYISTEGYLINQELITRKEESYL